MSHLSSTCLDEFLCVTTEGLPGFSGKPNGAGKREHKQLSAPWVVSRQLFFTHNPITNSYRQKLQHLCFSFQPPRASVTDAQVHPPNTVARGTEIQQRFKKEGWSSYRFISQTPGLSLGAPRAPAGDGAGTLHSCCSQEPEGLQGTAEPWPVLSELLCSRRCLQPRWGHLLLFPHSPAQPFMNISSVCLKAGLTEPRLSSRDAGICLPAGGLG